MICEVPECDNQVASNGLCDKHYHRVWRHGNVNSGRPKGWGAKASHPLYEAHNSMKRLASNSGGIAKEWNDFWQFVADVGDRPDGHRLCRIDKTKPYSKENTEWRSGGVLGIRTSRANHTIYMRAYNTRNPNKNRESKFKKLYGITVAEYDVMYDKQNGVCAICDLEETAKDRITGKPRKLAVDHCHKTGKVRGLLCTNCNTAIGRLKDDLSLFRAAVRYLKSHV